MMAKFMRDTQESLTHDFACRPIMCFAMVIGAKRRDVLDAIRPTLPKRHYVMSFEKHGTIRHREAVAVAPLAPSRRAR